VVSVLFACFPVILTFTIGADRVEVKVQDCVEISLSDLSRRAQLAREQLLELMLLATREHVRRAFVGSAWDPEARERMVTEQDRKAGALDEQIIALLEQGERDAAGENQ